MRMWQASRSTAGNRAWISGTALATPSSSTNERPWRPPADFAFEENSRTDPAVRFVAHGCPRTACSRPATPRGWARRDVWPEPFDFSRRRRSCGRRRRGGWADHELPHGQRSETVAVDVPTFRASVTGALPNRFVLRKPDRLEFDFEVAPAPIPAHPAEHRLGGRLTEPAATFASPRIAGSCRRRSTRTDGAAPVSASRRWRRESLAGFRSGPTTERPPSSTPCSSTRPTSAARTSTRSMPSPWTGREYLPGRPHLLAELPGFSNAPQHSYGGTEDTYDQDQRGGDRDRIRPIWAERPDFGTASPWTPRPAVVAGRTISPNFPGGEVRSRT
jgi:hypothetical protein